MTDAERFNQILDTWLGQADFHALTPYNQYRHWLDYQRLYERNFQNMLFWLLNPREGHQLGDFFIRELLAGLPLFADENQASLTRWVKQDTWLSDSALADMDMRQVCVASEAGLIDLVLVDPVNHWLIAIERKDQHVLTQGQLQKHMSWIKDNYPQHYWLGVVSDSRAGTRQHEHIDSNWLHIDDQWLVNALEKALPRAEHHVAPQLRDIASRLTQGAWKQDPVFIRIFPLLEAFATRHAVELDELSNLKIQLNPDEKATLLLNIDSQSAVTRALPALDKRNANSAEYTAVRHAVEHYELLQALRNLRLAA